MEDFKDGVEEEVEFEVIHDGYGIEQPRYDVEIDCLSSMIRYSPPKFVSGLVVRTTAKYVLVEYVLGNVTKIKWAWPQPSSMPMLYSKEGFLRRVSRSIKSSATNNDGKDACYACGEPTRVCGGWSFNHDYRVCTKCGK